MTRTRTTLAALALPLALAACAEPPSFGEPVYFTHSVMIEPEQAPLMMGTWSGPFEPINDNGGPGGMATMEITDVEGTLMRGTMTWERDGEVWRRETFTSAMAPAGHWNVLSTHGMLYHRKDTTWMEADIYLPDGGLYRHQLSRTDVDFGEGSYGGGHGHH